MRRVLSLFILLMLFQINSFAKEDKINAYPVSHSEKNFYAISNFTLENQSLKIQINHGYVLLGSTEKGFTEAIIIPEDGIAIGNANNLTIDSELDNLYLRFNPGWYKDNLSQFLKNSSSEEKIFKKAIEIHKEKFRNYFHAGSNAMLPPETILICDFDLSSSGIRIGSSFYQDKYFIVSDISDLWNRYEKGKFTIYYPENSLIKDTLKEWLDVRKEAFDNICDYLETNGDKVENVTFYVFNDMKQGLSYGRRLGYAVPPMREIYTRYDQSPGHELTHVISYWMNTKRIESALINEGLAVFLDQTDRNYNRISKYLFSEGKVSSEKSTFLLGDDFRKQKYGYMLGASFVSYLIDNYSLDKFKDFFTQNKYNEQDSFIHFYGKKGEELIDEWSAYIQKTDYGKLSDYENEYFSKINKLLKEHPEYF